jgi:phospholipid/cholesterol/gamma-HCH transport system permease protein
VSNPFSLFGGKVARLYRSAIDVFAYIGEAACVFIEAFFHPSRFRYGDFFLAFQRAAFDGLFITSGIGLLLGMILAFESAAALKTFGAEVYVSDLLAVGLFRELGPIVTAIVLAGRSGSAFAAEIGTMKVGEELDALTTMGISPVRFLVPPRVLAAVFAMPVLTVFTEIAGLVGGAVVLSLMGVPVEVFLERINGSMTVFPVILGLAKAALFGFAVGLVGCYAGMRARSTADAVGVAATNAVVGGIVSIAVIDGLWAVFCYICDV